MSVTVHHGDMLEVLPTLGARFHAVITDPPYHLASIVKRFGADGAAAAKVGATGAYARASKGFMGKQWDGGDIAFRPETWAAVGSVMLPGAHLVAFAGTKGAHRMACAIEDAGFEIRDTLAWLYGSGFPKSHDVSKGIDKAAGAEREVVGDYAVTREFKGRDYVGDSSHQSRVNITAPATDAARAWEGWGTALKPSHEDIVLAQKPYEIPQQIAIIGSTLYRLEHQLWSLLPANVAERHFGLSQSEYDAACASAQWSADERSNTRAALCDRMDTSQYVLATISSLSTVRLWRDCLDAASRHGSTSTTETESSTTIDPKIWKYCLSRITPDTIIQAHRQGAWSSANAGHAERYLNADALKWSATRELSALADALGSDAMNYREGAERTPLLEPIVLARWPMDRKTVAANVLAHGTGAINVDACRIESAGLPLIEKKIGGPDVAGKKVFGAGLSPISQHAGSTDAGRWPANVVHDGSDEVVRAFPDTGPSTASPRHNGEFKSVAKGRDAPHTTYGHADSGSAARFFYSAKADAGDRLQSKHPTVKPVDLMRWLVRLVTPKGGLVLDPFAGSGTTGMACMAEGFDCHLIEREAEYAADIRRRIAHVSGADAPLFASVPA